MDKKILITIIVLTSSLFLISSINSIQAGPVTSATDTQVTVKEGSTTIVSSASLKLTGQVTLPKNVILPNGTSTSLTNVGYIQFQNGDLFVIPKDNFVKFTNGTIRKEVPHMDNLPQGTIEIQPPSWMDNLPQNTTLVVPPQ